MPYLVKKKVDGSSLQRWFLPEKDLTVGRGESADVQIQDERASRQHFVVSPRDGGYFIRDLNSTNGTWVNGRQISETQLRPTDKIRVGETILVFEAS